MSPYSEYVENALSGVKYAIALLVMLAGASAMFAPLTPISGPLGLLYATRWGLVLFGVVTVASGLALFIGKVIRSKKLTGRGLMACYMCLLFATIIQGLAFMWDPGTWLLNAIFTIITGALWLRWKFKTEYVNPKHFREEVARMRAEG